MGNKLSYEQVFEDFTEGTHFVTKPFACKKMIYNSVQVDLLVFPGQTIRKHKIVSSSDGVEWDYYDIPIEVPLAWVQKIHSVDKIVCERGKLYVENSPVQNIVCDVR